MSKFVPASPTALGTWLLCPRQFDAKYISKTVVFQPSDASRYGDRAHKAIEYRLKQGLDLPSEFAHLEPMCAAVMRAPGTKLVEHSLPMTREFTACEWYSRYCGGKADFINVNGSDASVIDWKGLPLATPIPTPYGWLTMQELVEGDTVFGGDGQPARVVGKSSPKDVPCLRLRFDDRTSVVCDVEHRWRLIDGDVVQADALVVGDCIPVAPPADYPVAELPIDPYVLGLWLADGKQTNSEICKPDQFVWDEIARRGYSVGSDTGRPGAPVRTVLGIRALLRAMNLHQGKHVPMAYLTASVTQRLDLLRGLMDGDGNANPMRRQAVFTTTSKRLSDDVKQLLESLGQRVNQAVTQQTGFGVTVTAYPLAFRPQWFNPFLLPRKADRIDLATWGPGRSWRRKIVAVEPTLTLTTQCISVDSPDNTYLCTKNYLVTHNTGKVKEDMLQLNMLTMGVFAHFPHVQRVRAALVFIQSNETPGFTAQRERFQVPDLIRDLKAYEASQAAGDYPATRNGLCRAWCDVLTCEHNGKRAI